MPVALEQFVKQLADSGVIAPGKLEDFVPPKAQPKDAQELARQLVQSKQLTKFQVQEIYAGRARSLILGNYTIVDKIGAGGMGQVFKAEHRRMHRVVAIKMLPPAVTKDPPAIARFQREVEAAAKLRHTNVVAADDADEANGAHFLVMEYVEGSDLSALVKKNGPFPVAKAVNYTLQAARGLEFAHGEGVVHRDIKPSNLLLDKKGTVKILDMGLARIDARDDAATQAELTGTGAVLGTIDYMAPEQALSTHNVDARADIYSLGCSLHYLIAGKATYDGDTLMSKLLAHREKPIPSLGPDVPEEVQVVFEKMVAKKVEDRYQTMSEVVAALEQCSTGPQTSVSIQQSVDTSLESDALTFLKDAPPHASHISKKSKQAAPIKAGPNKAGTATAGSAKKKLVLGAVGAGFLGLAILAAVIFKLRTKDGTLVVEINQPDATVQVLDAEGKAEISQPSGEGAITISVDPGKHRLKVEKGGFQFFAQDFEMDSGGTASIKATLVEDKPWLKPAFLEWQKKVAAMPAEAQVEAVAKKLQELNPGFDGKVFELYHWGTPKVENGVVTELRFSTNNVTDISPVRALVGLKALWCIGTGQGKGILSDLSPLRGTSLTSLNCGWTQVTDLSPLKGMQLTKLDCDADPVRDLAPLQGMPLLELRCNRTQVLDLLPLTRVPALGTVDICGTKVALADVGALQKARPNCKIEWPTEGKFYSPRSTAPGQSGATLNDPAFQQWMKEVATLPAEKQVDAVAKKLQELNPGFDGRETHNIENGVVTVLTFDTKTMTDISPVRALAGLRSLACGEGRGTFSDLSPLKGMPLTALVCNNTRVSDLSPLEGMQLTDLGCWDTQVSDLSPLKGAKLTHLRCYRTEVSDLSPLKGMPLTTLNCCDTKVSDLSPLKGMHLTGMWFNGTGVSDLSPLEGMRLTALACDRSKVFDLSPLEGMPMTGLECNNTPVSDLSTLRGMPLTRLDCQSTPVSDLSPLQDCKSLSELDFTPRNITKGLDVIRKMQSLRSIGVSLDWKDKLPPADFWKKYDAGEFGKPITTLNDPAFQQWMKTVAAMSAEPQVEAVAKKLRELNPGFDGKETHKIENDVVTGLQFLTDNVADISPVRALAGLRNLNCANSMDWNKRGKLFDLSPLEGMQLTELRCDATNVSDLSPLKRMPLTKLSCDHTRVSYLAPLRGMRLSEVCCAQTSISDLSPLTGMPLARLWCFDTQVSDLSPLQGAAPTDIGFTPKNITKGMGIIREMKSLKTIRTWYSDNASPAAFWKKYDAGDFTKSQ